MKTRFNVPVLFVLFGAMILSTCGGAPAPAATVLGSFIERRILHASGTMVSLRSHRPDVLSGGNHNWLCKVIETT